MWVHRGWGGPGRARWRRVVRVRQLPKGAAVVGAAQRAAAAIMRLGHRGTDCADSVCRPSPAPDSMHRGRLHAPYHPQGGPPGRPGAGPVPAADICRALPGDTARGSTHALPHADLGRQAGRAPRLQFINSAPRIVNAAPRWLLGCGACTPHSAACGCLPPPRCTLRPLDRATARPHPRLHRAC